jgi:hypothetical protein
MHGVGAAMFAIWLARPHLSLHRPQFRMFW